MLWLDVWSSFICWSLSVTHFRKPVTSSYLRVSFPVAMLCDLFTRKQQTRICCGEFYGENVEKKNTSRTLPAQIIFTRFHSCVQDFNPAIIVFLGHAAGIKLQMFDWTRRGCLQCVECSCVCLSRLIPLPLSASCRVSRWLSSPPLTLSSDCFLSTVPDRK